MADTFDPVPTSETRLYATLRGRKYTAVRVVELAAGPLNAIMAVPAKLASALFATEVKFEHVTEYYDRQSMKDVSTTKAVTANVPPPIPFSIREINGSSVLAQDVRLIVPGSIFGQDVAAYDIQLRI